ncbi:unnamed protein product [Closterium sp. Naga37s-1]|nr:unnamed protein product [Closterium sp. Naga37s-1]
MGKGTGRREGKVGRGGKAKWRDEEEDEDEEEEEEEERRGKGRLGGNVVGGSGGPESVPAEAQMLMWHGVCVCVWGCEGKKSAPSFTRTLTPSFTRTLTPSFTRTLTPSFTRTLTPSFTLTLTPSTLTLTPSFTRTLTPSFTLTLTRSFTLTLTPSFTLTPTSPFTSFLTSPLLSSLSSLPSPLRSHLPSPLAFSPGQHGQLPAGNRHMIKKGHLLSAALIGRGTAYASSLSFTLPIDMTATSYLSTFNNIPPPSSFPILPPLFPLQMIKKGHMVSAALIGRGTAYALWGKLKTAIEDYSKVGDRGGAPMAEAWRRRAQACMADGQAEAAVKDLSRVVELEPHNMQAYNERGACATIPCHHATMASTPALATTDVLLQLAQSQRELGRVEDAEKSYLKALRLDPRHPQAYRVYSQFKQAMGDHRTALLVARQGLKLLPNDMDLRYTEASSVHALGIFSEAVQLYDSFLGINFPPDEERTKQFQAFYQRELTCYLAMRRHKPLPALKIDDELNPTFKECRCGATGGSPMVKLRGDGRRPDEKLRGDGRRPDEKLRGDGRRPDEKLRGDGRRPDEKLRGDGRRPDEKR